MLQQAVSVVCWNRTSTSEIQSTRRPTRHFSGPPTTSTAWWSLRRPAYEACHRRRSAHVASSTIYSVRTTALSSAFTLADKWTRLTSGKKKAKNPDLQSSTHQVEIQGILRFCYYKWHPISWQLRPIMPV